MIEEALASQDHANGQSKEDWWEVVGICKGSRVLPLIEAEGRAIREAERGTAKKKK